MSEWRTNRRTRQAFRTATGELDVDALLQDIREHPIATKTLGGHTTRYKRGLLMDVPIITYYKVVWNPVLRKFVSRRVVDENRPYGVVGGRQYTRYYADQEAEKANRLLATMPSAAERRNYRRRMEREQDRIYAEKSEHEHDCSEFGCDDRDDEDE